MDKLGPCRGAQGGSVLPGGRLGKDWESLVTKLAALAEYSGKEKLLSSLEAKFQRLWGFFVCFTEA